MKLAWIDALANLPTRYAREACANLLHLFEVPAPRSFLDCPMCQARLPSCFFLGYDFTDSQKLLRANQIPRSVSGHDFSRAASGLQSTSGFSPCYVNLWIEDLRHFSGAFAGIALKPRTQSSRYAAENREDWETTIPAPRLPYPETIFGAVVSPKKYAGPADYSIP